MRMRGPQYVFCIEGSINTHGDLMVGFVRRVMITPTPCLLNVYLKIRCGHIPIGRTMHISSIMFLLLMFLLYFILHIMFPLLLGSEKFPVHPLKKVPFLTEVNVAVG